MEIEQSEAGGDFVKPWKVVGSIDYESRNL